MNLKNINILVISPQVLFRQGIEVVLSSTEDIGIIGSIGFGNGVESTIDNSSPDIAIVDTDGLIDTGLNLARNIKKHSPNVAVIIMTSHPDDEQLFQAIKAQASAYLSKEAKGNEIIKVIRRVASGEYPINESLTQKPKVAEFVLNQFQKLSWQNDTEDMISPLTSRETEILGYVAKGFLNKQIAAELSISEQTIKNHITSILRKLNANARTEAVVIALKQGLLSLD